MIMRSEALGSEAAGDVKGDDGMPETFVGFVIWSIVGCVFIFLGIYSFFSRKPTGFWANVELFEVTDIKRYNGAVGKLFCGFGIIFIILGFPMLAGQNSPWIIISVVGVVFEVIAMMVIYTMVIEEKYKKK